MKKSMGLKTLLTSTLNSKTLNSKTLNSSTGIPDLEVTGVGYDSRKISSGEIFCCLRGKHSDGHNFVQEAIQRGASCLILEKEINETTLPTDLPQFIVENTRQVMAKLACEFWGNPSKKMTTVAVTGTNGKTTVTSFLAQMMGTGAQAIGTLTGNLTTPEAPELQAQLAQAHTNGCKFVALEVSSHGLSQSRVDGMEFDLAVFLNLGHDHLDYHLNMEDYFDAKARLFEPKMSLRALINTDTKWGELLCKRRLNATAFSTHSPEIVNASNLGSEFIWEGQKCFINLPGQLNVVNAIAALESIKLLGQDLDLGIAKLKTLIPVPGRFEVLKAHPYTVVVDYAHTPEALEATLKSARGIMPDQTKQLILIFGCGGERDKEKRPQMGRIATREADKVFLTSDNSRSENTEAIIAQIQTGIELQTNIEIQIDRYIAIRQALGEAEDGDLVLIAGKGHETKQITRDAIEDFDDRKVVKELLGSK